MSGISYRDYQIVMDSSPSPYKYAYAHKDFDMDDPRYGYGNDLMEILKDIDDYIEDEEATQRIAKNQ